MKKAAQSFMYIIPLAIVIGIFVLFVRGGSGAKQTESLDVETETQEIYAQNTEAETDTEMQENDSETQESQAEVQDSRTESTETETAMSPEAEMSEDVTIIFTGDVLFANAFKAGYDAKGIEGVVSGELLAKLQEADILMVNNEFPFSEQGTPMADKQFTFRCEPDYVTALQEMGVDVVSLANNHVLDYGKAALSDTFATLDNAGILYGGAGETVERAEEAQIIEINGRKYGFLAVSRVVPVGDWKVENSAPGVFSCYDDRRLVELVKEAAAECDFLAVYPHWGVEYADYPEDYQKKIAENCLEAGADVVAGSHTHCLQGAEYINGKPVFYSLGNFIFGQNIDCSAILEVTITSAGEISYRYLPVYAEGGVTKLAEGEKAEQICTYLNTISGGASVAEDGMVNRK